MARYLHKNGRNAVPAAEKRFFPLSGTCGGKYFQEFP